MQADGLFAFDIANPKISDLARHEDQLVRLDLGPNPSSAIPVEEAAIYDPVRQVRDAYWHVNDPIAGPRNLAPLSLRQIFPQELLSLLKVAGFEQIERYGDFSFGAFGPDSLNQICLCRTIDLASLSRLGPATND
jgi:hypothetical protein